MGNPHDLKFGLSTEGGPFAADDLLATAAAVGRRLNWVLWYEEFVAPPPVAALDAVKRLGARPVITWEPWQWATRDASIMTTLRSGCYDGHLRHWAAQLRRWDSTVQLRFGHEFNGQWYPWSRAAGTRPDAYVEAWRHLHTIFTDAGAANVQWTWSLNAGVTTGEPIEQWYPGDDYVDVVGIDGYNWGTSCDCGVWVDPAALFDGSLAETRTVAPDKPIVITEVGCAEAGGSKSAWNTALVDYLTVQPEIEGFIWFDHDKETDWRIESSRASAAAMATALRARPPAERPAG